MYVSSGNSVRVLTSGNLKPMTLSLLVREVLPLFPAMLLPEVYLVSVTMWTRLILLGKNLNPLKSKNICLLPKWSQSILKKTKPTNTTTNLPARPQAGHSGRGPGWGPGHSWGCAAGAETKPRAQRERLKRLKAPLGWKQKLCRFKELWFIFHVVIGSVTVHSEKCKT